jgi:STI1 domain
LNLRLSLRQINSSDSNADDDRERRAHAMADPQIQAILSDPVVQQVLQDMQHVSTQFSVLMRTYGTVRVLIQK